MPDINPGENTAPVNELFAFVSIDKGGEGLCGFQNAQGQWLPMVGTTRKNAEMLKPIAFHMMKTTPGKKIRLVWFKRDRTEDLALV